MPQWPWWTLQVTVATCVLEEKLYTKTCPSGARVTNKTKLQTQSVNCRSHWPIIDGNDTWTAKETKQNKSPKKAKKTIAQFPQKSKKTSLWIKWALSVHLYQLKQPKKPKNNHTVSPQQEQDYLGPYLISFDATASIFDSKWDHTPLECLSGHSELCKLQLLHMNLKISRTPKLVPQGPGWHTKQNFKHKS